MITVRTSFDPVVNGFKFINRFELPGLANLILPGLIINTVSLGSIVYGLCGGMSYGALDYFHAGQPVPNFDNVDDISVGLYRFLVNRQLNSLGGGTLLKVIAWMAMEDDDLALRMVGNEIPALTASLASGSPVPLVLVRVHGLVDPTHNHQVTAVGYDTDPVTNLMTVYLYDPNHPGEEPSLSMDLSNPGQGIQLAQSTGEVLRGFFVGDYQAQAPA